MQITGTFYAAAAKMSITASGDFTNTYGSQYIVYDLNVTGSGSFVIRYGGPNSAPVRVIQLVE
jgi:hypothetical protein